MFKHKVCVVCHILSRGSDTSKYRTIFLPVVLYGCETWSLTLREEHRLRVFENRVLRIFGPKSDGVTGEWRMRIACEGVEWIRLRNRGSCHPAADD
jgi:hypothetical protein